MLKLVLVVKVTAQIGLREPTDIAADFGNEGATDGSQSGQHLYT